MLKKFSIIIADDDIDDQYLVKQAIVETQINYEVTSVYNGLQLMDFLLRREAYRNIPDNLPDLILLDINMPILNGFGVLAQIKENPAFSDIPIYILTTSNSEFDKIKARQLGAMGFYTKPVNYNDLKSIIREVTSNTNSRVVR
jgi:two-component system response regulator